MMTTSTFAEIAALVGDPARANMLAALMDGRALTATELAGAASVQPQTASGHLARMTGAGLLAVERQGRHRYHRLASPAVAQMLESIMAVSAALRSDTGRSDYGQPASRRVTVGPRDAAMRQARTCYDHLAGEIAVAIADRMVERGHIELSPDGGALTEAGGGFLRDLGVHLDVSTDRAIHRLGGRVFCRPCLDWSERRPHLAGVLGALLCRTCLDNGWIRRRDGTRALSITPTGRQTFARAFDIRLDILRLAP
jgi:DNA-binding transcriptional ArsR family regulator